MFFFCFLAVVPLVAPCARGAERCPQLAVAPHSQWRVEADNTGVFWLRTPCDERFLSLGVNVVNEGYPRRVFNGRLSYHWATFYPTLEAWAASAQQRLLAWGFNTAGAWSVEPAKLLLPFMPDLELGRMSEFHWFDPLHPAMEEEMRTWAHRLVAPYKGNPYRIGYFSDNEIGWWYGAMFTYYLQQPATNYTKQKLLALLQEEYGGDWERFGRDFVPPAGVSSFAALLQSSGRVTQLRVGGAGIHVVRRWTGIVAEQYYRLLHRAIREADPEALIFADRLQIYYDPNAVRPMGPYVDAIATNYNVDSEDGWVARYYFDGLQQLTGNKPILISEWFFAAHENRTGNRNDGHLMTVQTQVERAQGAAAATQRFLHMPQLLGLHWFQYYDHPSGGRPDGEDYNFGLVDIHDQPYEELTTALSQVNRRLVELHQAARPWSPATPSGVPLQIPAADINARDHTLREWPKEQAFVPGLRAPAPEIVFGDVYLAWNRTGLYLATISMDYYDPKLLAFGDTFPLEEAFHLDWGIDAGTGPQRFALYIIPPKVYPTSGPALTRAYLCRLGHHTCADVPTAVASYFGADSPRIIAEVALPWSVLGLDGPPAERQVRMELAATAYHRARWMSWSGQPPAVGLQDPTTWQMVQLAGSLR
jgi:hypothetical protein